jgi:hypothetical protein
MSCCNKILDLSTTGACFDDMIDLGITAKDQGEYRLELNFLDSIFVLRNIFEVDDQIIFPTKSLNEYYQFVGTLYDPAGATVVIEKGGVLYDCIKFQTKIYNDVA